MTYRSGGGGTYGAYANQDDIRPATAAHQGLMPAADKAKLDAATSANTGGTLVLRDGGGNVTVGNINTGALNGQTLVAHSTDANGWAIDQYASGKKVWRKRFLAVATAAAQSVAATSASALPVGVSAQSAVDIWCQVRMANFSSILVAGVDGAEATTTLTIFVSTTDGSNTNAHNAAVDVFCRLEER